MQMIETDFSGRQPVDGYGTGFFRIGGQVWEGPVLTGPEGTRHWDGLVDRAALLALAGRVDILLIGTGAIAARLAPDLIDSLSAACIGAEAMASPPACRTYNVLLAEGRRVALAALPV
ncbi:MAG: Mth938-like domain-containing protein [Marinibacterium sp.]